ncbi:DUF2953 domain-containing protein [Bacillus alkalicellulosilyticus]|uniref:DUF2953 domain-containing protein n=1 Tax=Alkalihalobacterium alkalicellulosilyticum TaxID=1912214 RepID=UPI000995E81A|nr:DUF2953 domain-containing protein [Bacillus alkalicellulosilyticus]
MNWVIAALVLLLIFFLILVVTKITIHITYYHHGVDDELVVRMQAWKIITYTMKLPLIKIDDDSASVIVEEEHGVGEADSKKKLKITPEYLVEKFRQLKEFLQHIVGFHKIVRKFLRKVSVRDIKWNSQIGIHDAALTGFLSGMIWSVKGGIIGIISNYFRLLEKPKLSITPNFQRKVTRTDFSCIISFRLGHAIIAGLLIVRHWKKRPSFFQSVDEKVSG